MSVISEHVPQVSLDDETKGVEPESLSKKILTLTQTPGNFKVATPTLTSTAPPMPLPLCIYFTYLLVYLDATCSSNRL